MKLLRIIIALSLFIQVSFCSAMQNGSYTIHTGNTATYTLPDELIDKVADVFTNRLVKDLGASTPTWLNEISNSSALLASNLSHNMAWICSGTVIGALGAYLACKGISRYFDHDKNKESEHTHSHLKLTALGIAIMAGAGLTVNALLK